MLIHRICTGRMGRATPAKMAARMTSPSPRLVGSVQAMNLVRLSKTPRPSSTAASMEAKLSSVSTMSAASLATSVPVMPMATPMSAWRERRGVVDAVAGHGHHVALALQGVAPGAASVPE